MAAAALYGDDAASRQGEGAASEGGAAPAPGGSAVLLRLVLEAVICVLEGVPVAGARLLGPQAGQALQGGGVKDQQGHSPPPLLATRRQASTHLTHFVHAAVSLPQAGDQEADHDETEDQQRRHHQTQERHVAGPVPDGGGGLGGHSCGGQQLHMTYLGDVWKQKDSGGKGHMISPGKT